MLRPGRLLALLKRTFTPELAPVGSPRTNVEYDYVGRQPVPTTGLAPASHAALWAAQCPLFLPPLFLPATAHEKKGEKHDWQWKTK
jgi:hypothetical protein